MITTTIKISKEQHNFLQEKYKNVSEGVRQCVDNIRYPPSSLPEILRQIRLYSLRELKGKFSKEEWCFFFDSLNGTIVDSPFRCNVQALVFHCEDSEQLDGTATKWNVDVNTLIEKVRTLTSAQTDALYTFVEDFWNDDNRDLEKASTQLL